jgi:hypothetical protein
MKWKFQYSLSSLLWLTVCSALLVTSILMYRRAREAERATAAAVCQTLLMRSTIGYLEIGDKALVHAREIETRERLKWQWRMFLPEDHHFTVKIACGKIPAEGTPANAEVVEELRIPFSGELIISVNNKGWMMDVEARDAKFDFEKSMYVGTRTAFTSFRIPSSIVSRYTTNSGEQVISFGDFLTQTESPDRPIVLRRDRFLKKQDGSNIPATEPAPGIMIWLEEQKQPTTNNKT